VSLSLGESRYLVPQVIIIKHAIVYSLDGVTLKRMAYDAHSNIGGTRSKVQRYSLNLRWSIPIHSVPRSLEFMDDQYKITLGFLGLLLLLLLAALFWYRRRENILSRNEERTRREQELADAEMERVRRESILSVLPSKV
jgi:LPXTG-motif cell wall-anchored protein